MRTTEQVFDLRCQECGAMIEPAASEPHSITHPRDVWPHLRGLRARRTEALVVITVDAQNNVLGRHLVTAGTLNTVRTHPREVVMAAMKDSAAAVIIAHNHPSGCVRVSENDKAFTRRMKEVLELCGFELLDHVLVA